MFTIIVLEPVFNKADDASPVKMKMGQPESFVCFFCDSNTLMVLVAAQLLSVRENTCSLIHPAASAVV